MRTQSSSTILIRVAQVSALLLCLLLKLLSSSIWVIINSWPRTYEENFLFLSFGSLCFTSQTQSYFWVLEIHYFITPKYLLPRLLRVTQKLITWMLAQRASICRPMKNFCKERLQVPFFLEVSFQKLGKPQRDRKGVGRVGQMSGHFI